MAATETLTPATRLPGPPELLPGRPDAIVDLQTADGAALVGARVALRRRARRGDRLRRASARRGPARPGHGRRTAPTTSSRTPRPPTSTTPAGARSRPRRRCSGSRTAASASTGTGSTSRSPSGSATSTRPARRSSSRSSIDDYAEVWVDGELPLALGDTGGHGRRRLQRAEPRRAHPRRPARADVPDRRLRHQRPDLRLAAQLHLDAHGDARLLRRRARAGRRARPPLEVERRPDRRSSRPTSRLERVAGGFEFTEGPVWTRDGALLFSSPNTNAIYRWTPDGASPCSARRAATPASTSAATTSPARTGSPSTREGRLTICQHGNRRVIRVNPHGDMTVLADRYDGQAAEQPERPRLPLRRHALLHRSAVRAARTSRRPGEGARLQRRLPRRATARSRCSTDELAGPERPRVLARRALAVRRQLGLRAEGRHALRRRRRRARAARSSST